MVEDAEKDGVARLAGENDGRITPVGKFIRRLRIDELPQIINIIKGDMSIVGPRPERPELAGGIQLPSKGAGRAHGLCPGTGEVQHDPL